MFEQYYPQPKMGTGEMSWPWMESWRNEIHLQRKIMEDGGNFTDDVVTNLTFQKPWHARIPKAAFFSGYRSLRRLVNSHNIITVH